MNDKYLVKAKLTMVFPYAVGSRKWRFTGTWEELHSHVVRVMLSERCDNITVYVTADGEVTKYYLSDGDVRVKLFGCDNV
jgi:hypothetical protein